MFRLSIASVALGILPWMHSVNLVLALSFDGPPTSYKYFGYGSNVLPSTMTALRRIKPLNSAAAILPGYALKFDGSTASRLEPSSAFVVPTNNPNDYVHGVVYTLTPEDFAKVGTTEGVPLAYRWQRCQVFPYVGRPGENAGQERLLDTENAGSAGPPVEAVTLIPPRLEKFTQKDYCDVPPSSSYLGIIQEGARFWNFDASYQEQLAAVPTAQNLIIPQGLSGLLLKAAELVSATKGSQ